jgi:hypothetical protein
MFSLFRHGSPRLFMHSAATWTQTAKYQWIGARYGGLKCPAAGAEVTQCLIPERYTLYFPYPRPERPHYTMNTIKSFSGSADAERWSLQAGFTTFKPFPSKSAILSDHREFLGSGYRSTQIEM